MPSDWRGILEAITAPIVFFAWVLGILPFGVAAMLATHAVGDSASAILAVGALVLEAATIAAVIRIIVKTPESLVYTRAEHFARERGIDNVPLHENAPSVPPSMNVQPIQPPLSQNEKRDKGT